MTPVLAGNTVTFFGGLAAEELFLSVNNVGELEFSVDGTSFSSDLDPTSSEQQLVVSSGTRIRIELGGGADEAFLDQALTNAIAQQGAKLTISSGLLGEADTLTGPAGAWEVTGTDWLPGDSLFEFHTGIVSGAAGGLLVSSSSELTVEQDLFMDYSLTLHSLDTLTIGSAATSPTISTRDTTGDPLTGASQGPSAHLLLSARAIDIKPGTRILTHATAGHTPGDVQIVASDLSGIVLPIVQIKNAAASVTVDDALIRGGDVTISADANAAQAFDDASPLVEALLETLDMLTTLGGVALSDASATVAIGSGSEILADRLDLSASAFTEAKVLAISSALSVVYGKTDTKAAVLIESGVTINTAGDVKIASLADSTTSLSAISGNLGSRGPNLAATVAVSEADLESVARIASGAEINAGGDLSLRAFSNRYHVASASGGGYDNGSVGLALAVATSHTNTNAILEGDVQVAGDVDVLADARVPRDDAVAGSSQGTNAFSAAIQVGPSASNRIKDFMSSKVSATGTSQPTALTAALAYTEHTTNVNAQVGRPAVDDIGFDPANITGGTEIILDGPSSLSTGDALVYHASDPANPIGGLNHGDLVYATMTNGTSIKLVTQRDDAFSAAPAFLALDGTNATGDHRFTRFADLDAGGSVNVTSFLEHVPEYAAMSAVNSDLIDATSAGNTKENSFSFAVVIGNVTNHVNALIGTYANVDAVEAVSVEATSSIPHEIRWLWIQDKPDTTFDPREDIDSDHDEIDLAQPHGYETGQAIIYDPNGGGSISGLEPANPDDPNKFHVIVVNPTTIKLALTEADALSGDAIDITASTAVGEVHKFSTIDSPAELSTIFFDHLNGNLGLQNGLFTTWAQSMAQGTKTATAGSLTILNVTNHTLAYIEDGAQVIQSADAAEALVAVRARNDVETLNLSGVFSIGQLLDAIKALFGSKTTVTPATAGVGVSYLGLNYINNAEAVIRDGATVEANALEVLAAADIKSINIAEAGGKAGTFGANGSIALVTIDNDTYAQIENGAQVTTRSGVIDLEGLDDPNVLVTARDETTTITGGGGVVKSKNVGIGASVAVNDIDRTTIALIGDRESGDRSGRTLTSGGLVDVSATNTGLISTWSLAAAVAVPDEQVSNNPADGKSLSDVSSDAPPETGGAKWGAAFSGTVSLNTIVDVTEAVIRGADILADGDVTLSATNEASIVSVGGSVAFSKASKSSTGLAGAYAENTLQNGTRAIVEDSLVETGNDLKATATSAGSVTAITAGGSGSSRAKKANNTTSIQVAGSVAINTITNETVAQVVDSETITGRNLALEAIDMASVFAIGGAVTINAAGKGGKAGVGASVGVNVIDNRTAATFDRSTLNADGGVIMKAQSGATIQAITAAISGTTAGKGLAAASANSVNHVTNEITVSISGLLGDPAVIDAQGTVTLDAIDNSTIESITGYISAAVGTTAGFGGSYAENLIRNHVTATIERATVTSTIGSILLSGESTASIRGVAAGGAGGQSFALGGSVALNDIQNTVDVHIYEEAGVSSENEVTLSATDNSSIEVVAGNVAFARDSGAVGAAVGKNEIRNTTRAFVEDATVASLTGAVSLLVDSTSNIASITAGGTAAGSFALGGSVSVNNIFHTIEARVDDAELDAATAIGISATDNSMIHSLAGTVTGGGSASIGAAVATNNIGNRTSALARNSQLNVTLGGVHITASSPATIQSLSAGVSGSGTVAITGSVSANDIGNTIEARASLSTAITARDDILLSATDSATIESLSGQAGGAGSAAIGGATAHNYIHNMVTAKGDDATLTSIEGGIDVSADSTGTISTITAGGSGGGTFAGAGSVATNLMENVVTAELTSATATADDTVTVVADSNNSTTMYGGTLSVGGTVGFGGTVVVSTLANSTSAKIDGSAISVKGNGTSPVPEAVPSNVAPDHDVRGLGVIANSLGSINVFTANAGNAVGGVVAGVAANVSVNIIEDAAHATISGSTVNDDLIGVHSGQEVLVVAVNNAEVDVKAGGLAIGGVAGVGATSDTTTIATTTTASIAGDSNVNAANDVQVVTDSRERVNSITISGAGAGVVTLAGNEVVVNLESVNELFVENSTVTAVNDLRLLADDRVDLGIHEDGTRTGILAGSIAIGGVGGVGGSVVVNKIDNTTTARITDSTTKAGGTTVVDADSVENLLTYAASGAGGGFVGAAGAVVVNTIDVTTSAYIDESTQTSINSDPAFARADQNVSVWATDNADIEVVFGAVGVGAIGIGAAIDVSNITNTTTAAISSGVEASAVGDVAVRASAEKDIDSTVVAAGGGAIGVQGAVSVANLGSAISDDGLAASENTSAAVDGQIGGSPFGNQMGDSAEANRIESRAEPRASGFSVGDRFDTNAQFAQETSARIGNGAIIITDGNVLVSSTETTNVQITAGAAVGGALGIGGGVGIANVHNNARAVVGQAVQIHAGGDVSILASANVDQGRVDGFAGAVGAVGIGAAVGVLTSDNDATAMIGDSAVISSANHVEVSATTSSDLATRGVGRALGVAAVGVVVSTASELGTTSATVGNGATIGNAAAGGVTVDRLTVNATTSGSVLTDATAGALALAGGNGSVATSLATPVVQARIGDEANVEVSNDTVVTGSANYTVDADSFGANLGRLTVGVAVSSAEASSHVAASIGNEATIVGAGVEVAADSTDRAIAWSRAASGGGLTGSGGVSTSDASPTLLASIGSNATITTSENVSIVADGIVFSKSTAVGVAHAGAGVGLSWATASASPDYDAEVGSSSQLNADGDVSVRTTLNTNGAGNSTGTITEAISNASAGTLVGGSGAQAVVNSHPTIGATIHSNATISADHDDSGAGDVHVISQSHHESSAHATGATDGFLTFGSTESNLNQTTSVTTLIETGASIDGFNVKICSLSDAVALAEAQGGAGDSIDDFLEGLFQPGNIAGAFGSLPSILAVGGAATTIVLDNNATTEIQSGVEVTATEQIEISALATTDIDGQTNMSSEAFGLAASATAVTDIQFDTDAIVTIGDNARIEALLVEIIADNQTDADSHADAQTNVDVGGAFGTAITRVDTASATGVARTSEARINLLGSPDIVANDLLRLRALNHQLDPAAANVLHSNATSASDGGFLGNAVTHSEGTVNVRAVIDGPTANLIAGDQGFREIFANADYAMLRTSNASATTFITRTVQQVANVAREVTSYVCGWLGPFSSFCNTVTSTVIDTVVTFVEVIEPFSMENSSTGGAGVVESSSVNADFNDPPVATDDGYTTTDNDIPVFDVLANDLDEGLVFVLSVDRTSMLGARITILSQAAGIIYDPTTSNVLNALGPNDPPLVDTFEYVVSDEFGAFDTAVVTVTVNGVNDQPRAVDDSFGAYNTRKDHILNQVGLLLNDSDPEGDPLTLSSYSSTSTLGATVIVNTDGSFTYDPTVSNHPIINQLGIGESAVDTFTYTVSDGELTGTAAVEVVVRGLNTAPDARDDRWDSPFNPDLITSEDQSISIELDPPLPDQSQIEWDASTTSESVVHQSFTAGRSGRLSSVILNQDENSNSSSVIEIRAGGSADGRLLSTTLHDWSNAGTTSVRFDIPPRVSQGNVYSIVIHDAPSLRFKTGVFGDPYPGGALNHVFGGDLFFRTFVQPPSSALLDNDSDPEGDGFQVTSFQATSDLGANVHVAPNGELHYNPRFSTVLNNLKSGEYAVDTFEYTVTDIHGLTDKATVAIRVDGQSDAPVATDDTFTVQAGGTLASQPVLPTLDQSSTFSNTDLPFATGEVYQTFTAGQSGELTAIVLYAAGPLSGSSTIAIREGAGLGGVVLASTNHEWTVSGDGVTIVTFETPASVRAGEIYSIDLSDGSPTGSTVANANRLKVGSTGFSPRNYLVHVPSLGETFDTGWDLSFQTYVRQNDYALFDNDFDSDGDLLTLVSFDAVSSIGVDVHVSADGLLSYDAGNLSAFNTLRVGEHLTNTFTYQINDGSHTDTATVTLTIEGINDPPVAADEDLVTDEDMDLDINTYSLLLNDTDVDGDVLSLLDVGQPAHGALRVLDQDTYRYSPNENYFGPDSFSYTIDDGQGGTATGTVSIMVNDVNDPPVAIDDIFTTDEDTVLAESAPVIDQSQTTFTIGLGFAAGDVYQTFTAGTSGVLEAIVLFQNSPYGGETTISIREGIGLSGSLLATTTFEWSIGGEKTIPFAAPAAIQAGQVYTIDLSDGVPSGATVPTAQSLLVSNTDSYGGGYLINQPWLEETVDTGWDLYFKTIVSHPGANVLANDTDIDNDTLTVLAFDAESLLGVTINMAPDGSFSYDPAEITNHEIFSTGEAFHDRFDYIVSDSRGGTYTATVTIHVEGVNDPPSANDDQYSLNNIESWPPESFGALDIDLRVGSNSSIGFAAGNVYQTFTPGRTGDLTSIDLFADGDIDGTSTIHIRAGAGLDGDILASTTYDWEFQFVNNIEFSVPAHVEAGQVYTIDLSHGVPSGSTTNDAAGLAINPVPYSGGFLVNEPWYGVASDIGWNLDFSTYVAETTVGVGGRSVLLNDDDLDYRDYRFPGMFITAFDSVSAQGVAVSMEPDGTFTYDPTTVPALYNLPRGEVVVDTFQYTMSDTEGATTTATVSITVTGANKPPIAVDSTHVTSEDTALLISVLSDVTDPEGQAFQGFWGPIPGSCCEPTGHGYVTGYGDGTFTYIPNPDYFGPDSFEYFVYDFYNDFTTATVNITVEPVDDAPVAVDDTYDFDPDSAPTVTRLLEDQSNLHPSNQPFSLQPYEFPPTIYQTFTAGLSGELESLVLYGQGVRPVNSQIRVRAGEGLSGQTLATASHNFSVSSGEQLVTFATPASLTAGEIYTVDLSFTDPYLALEIDQDNGYANGHLIHEPATGETTDVGWDLKFQTNVAVGGSSSIDQQNDSATNSFDAIRQGRIFQTFTAGLSGQLDEFLVNGGHHSPTTIQLRAGAGLAGSVIASTTHEWSPSGEQRIRFNSPAFLQIGHQYTIEFVESPDSLLASQDNDYLAGFLVHEPGLDLSFDTGWDILFQTSIVSEEGVLLNDTHGDGDPLVVTSFDPASTLGGSVRVAPDGLFIYDPNQATDLVALGAGEAITDTFTYTVTDANGDTDTATVSVVVSGENDVPVAVDDLYVTDEDTPLVISAMSLISNDVELDSSDTLTIAGFTQPLFGSLADNSDGTLTYVPDQDFFGDDFFVYTVSDGNGGSASATVTIAVGPVIDVPVALIDFFVIRADLVLSPLALTTRVDQENDAPTSSMEFPTGVAYQTFTAGLSGTLNELVLFQQSDFDGTSTIAIRQGAGVDGPVLATATHAWSASGESAVTFDNPAVIIEGETYTIDLSGGVPMGSTAAAAKHLQVTNNNAYAGGILINPVGMGLSIDVGWDLAFRTVVEPLGSGLLLNDTHGDRERLTATEFDGFSALGARVVVSPNGLFTYDPTSAPSFNDLLPGVTRFDNFSYTVHDGNGASDTAEVSVRVVGYNHPPIASNNSYFVQEDSMVSISRASLLSNDTDREGDSITFQSVSQPSVGSLFYNPFTSTYNYTPPPNYLGTATFTYEISATGGSSTATVTITVNPVNDAPVANHVTYRAGKDYTLEVGEGIGVVANDIDVDGDTLTALLVNDVSNGTLTLNLDGSFSYLPNPGFEGTDTFSYRANDGNIDSIQAATVTIVVAEASIAGRHVFYNHSDWDGDLNGDDQIANANDDLAIATDKSPLLPGGTASFANYTSFVHGINGVMIDIADLPIGPSLDPETDFEFAVGNDDTPDNWTAVSAIPAVDVRRGAGAGGSDRITLIWPDGEIVGCWLQVRVKATATTGLSADDVFYFGNAPGEMGNSTDNAFVNAIDFVGTRANPKDFIDPAEIDTRFDFNRDGRVNSTDLLIVRDNVTGLSDSLRLIFSTGNLTKWLLPEYVSVTSEGEKRGISKRVVHCDPEPLFSRTLADTDLIFASYATLDDSHDESSKMSNYASRKLPLSESWLDDLVALLAAENIKEA